MTVRLLALRCPGCGNDFPAAENDVIFACPSCGKASVIQGEALKDVPLAFAQAAPEFSAASAGPFLYFPFWWYKVSARLAAKKPAHEKTVERFNDVKNVFVAAFALRGLHTFGDPGMAFTERRIEPRLDAGRLAPVLGGSRSAEEARRWAPLTLLAQVDRLMDVGDVHMSLRREEESLLAVPFADEGTRFRDLLAGERYPKHIFLDLASIERAMEKGKKA